MLTISGERNDVCQGCPQTIESDNAENCRTECVWELEPWPAGRREAHGVGVGLSGHSVGGDWVFGFLFFSII